MKIKKIISLFLTSCLLTSSCFPGVTAVENAHAASVKSRVSVHDPSIFKDNDGTYYVFGSHIEAAKTNDLQNWTRFTNGYTTPNNAEFGDLSANLAKAFAWSGENLEDCEGGYAVWAPDVIYNPDYVNTDGTKGAYLMYFCTSSTYMCSVIGFATAQKAEGPYTFVDTLIYSGFTENDSYATSSTKNVNRKYTSTNIDELIASGAVTYNSNWFRKSNYNNYLYPNAIDPTIYYDTDGKMYMCYGSWSGGIFTLEIDPATGRCIHPKTGTTSDSRMVDSYFGTKISGGYFKSGEGPFIEYNPDTGYYYLWVTYGGLTATGGYNMRVFRSKNPDGSFYDAAGNPAVLGTNTNLDSVGLKVMGNYQFSSLHTAYMACGHNSVLRDDDGKWYLFYHTRFNNGTEFHEVRVHSMYFNEEGWPVVSPYEYSGDQIAQYGYEAADIAGEYEYINHGNDTSSKIHNYSSVMLSTDGTISGAVSGTWSQAQDSAAAVLTIDGQKYSGYFLAAQDENGKNVMSFTAVGSNNQTIWGAKTVEYTGKERTPLIDYTDTSSKLVYHADSAQGTGETVKLCNTNLLSGVSYSITNKFSGKAIDLTGGNVSNGTNIQQWTKTAGSHQEWRIIADKDGYCRIASMTDESMCIAVAESTADNGINVELQPYHGTDNQLWKLVKNGTSYGIVSKCSGDTAGLDVYDWSKENGGNINQWNFWGGDCQLWEIKPVHPMVTDGTYTIRNLNSSLFLSQNDGNAVQGTETVWTFTRLDDGSYTVQTADGKALTVENGLADNGTNIVLKDYSGDDSQKFTLQCNQDGSYTLLSIVSDGQSCADVYEISVENGANICQWEYWGGGGQKFILEPAAPKKAVIGDVNADGAFNVADVVLLQKWLIAVPNVVLIDWKAGDLCEDDRLNVFDLCLMKSALIEQRLS